MRSDIALDKPSVVRRGGSAFRVAGGGQSTIETAILMAAVVLALVGFFTFLRNAVASRFKGGADAFGHGLQYEGNRK